MDSHRSDAGVLRSVQRPSSPSAGETAGSFRGIRRPNPNNRREERNRRAETFPSAGRDARPHPSAARHRSARSPWHRFASRSGRALSRPAKRQTRSQDLRGTPATNRGREASGTRSQRHVRRRRLTGDRPTRRVGRYENHPDHPPGRTPATTGPRDFEERRFVTRPSNVGAPDGDRPAGTPAATGVRRYGRDSGGRAGRARCRRSPVTRRSHRRAYSWRGLRAGRRRRGARGRPSRPRAR